MKLYDLHTHTTHSDGVLIPSESARRALVAGYSGIAITDHADSSNILYLLEAYHRFKETFNTTAIDFKVITGVELTHVAPKDIGKLTEIAKKNGADIVVVHGETIAEPVETGTNRAAIEANVDILAHPGLLSIEDAELAAKNNVYLELTTRKGHSYTNAYVANMARNVGASLVINNDAHSPSDYVGLDMAIKILKGSGLSDNEINNVFDNNKNIFEKAYGGI